MRRLLLLVLAGAVALLAIGAATGLAGHANALTRQRQELMQRATEQSQLLNDYFERSRSIMLITAQNPAFAGLYDLPGTHDDRIGSGGEVLGQANAAMDYLEKLYPDRIGEACFIDADGGENARVVRGEWAPTDDLSPDEASNPFFHPTFALKQGQVYQAKPYVSPDTNEWVLANSTPVPSRDGVNHAIVHFEVTVESFRQEEAAHAPVPLFVVDADTGSVVLVTARPQRTDAPLGNPGDHWFAGLVSGWKGSGQLNIGGRIGAYQRVADTPGNANHWYAVALAPSPVNPLTGVGSLAIVLVAVSLLLVAYLSVVLWRGQLVLVRPAYTDALTGLHNRRRLTADLNAGLRRATERDPLLLILCDLNGFKVYNDTFGHPAGDALLTRLGGTPAPPLHRRARAYRRGGGELCGLAPPRTGGGDR